MALDIDQLDAIIDKFMDYARPGETKLRPVQPGPGGRPRDAGASATRRRSASPRAWRSTLTVLADEIELGRVFANLFENARRYGRAHRHRHRRWCTVSYARTGPWVIVSVRDHGPGVAPEKLQPADHAVLPRRRRAHGRHRRRPGPGDRREGDAAHGRRARARQRARRRPGRPHPAEARALSCAASTRRASAPPPARCSRQTARASIARPSPTGPIFSAVLALTLTWPTSRRRAQRRCARASPRCAAPASAPAR